MRTHVHVVLKKKWSGGASSFCFLFICKRVIATVYCIRYSIQYRCKYRCKNIRVPIPVQIGTVARINILLKSITGIHSSAVDYIARVHVCTSHLDNYAVCM